MFFLKVGKFDQKVIVVLNHFNVSPKMIVVQLKHWLIMWNSMEVKCLIVNKMCYRVYKWNCLFSLLSVLVFLLYPSGKKNKPDRRLDRKNLNIRTSNLKMYVVEIRSRNLNSIITSSKMDSASKNRSLCFWTSSFRVQLPFVVCLRYRKAAICSIGLKKPLSAPRNQSIIYGCKNNFLKISSVCALNYLFLKREDQTTLKFSSD